MSDGDNRKATLTGEVTDTIKTAMADFSITLFQGIVTKDSTNDLVSPLSAVICLAMIANGDESRIKYRLTHITDSKLLMHSDLLTSLNSQKQSCGVSRV